MQRRPRKGQWPADDVATLLEAHATDYPGSYTNAYAACPKYSNECVRAKLAYESTKAKSATKRVRHSRCPVNGGPVVNSKRQSFLDIEPEYNPELPPIDSHALLHRIAEGIPIRKAGRAATSCFYCGVVGLVAPKGKKIHGTRLQRIEGLEEKLECVNVANCEARICRSAA